MIPHPDTAAGRELRRRTVSEGDLVRAAWDGRAEVVRIPEPGPHCECGHPMVCHLQGHYACCVEHCKCRLARRFYGHPEFVEMIRVSL